MDRKENPDIISYKTTCIKMVQRRTLAMTLITHLPLLIKVEEDRTLTDHKTEFKAIPLFLKGRKEVVK